MTSPSRSYPRFPPEICDLFVGALDEWPPTETQVRTLGACSLVSRSFAHSARKHLFRHVLAGEWTPNTELDTLTTLYELVSWEPSSTQGGIPNIVRYIEELSCCCDHILPAGLEAEQWDSIFSAILQCMHGSDYGIRTLSIVCNETWSELGLGFQHAFRDLLLSPHLTSLKMAMLWDLPKTLLVGSHLQHLSLRDCSVNESSKSIHSSSRYPNATALFPSLESIEVDFSYMALFESDSLAGNERSPSALSSLQTLHWNTHYAPGRGDIVTFSSVQNTIEFLDITFGQYAGSMRPSVFDLAAMKNLKRLRISDHRMENTAVFSPIIDIGLGDSKLLDWLQVPDTLELFELNHVLYLGEDVTSIDFLLDSFATNQWSRLNQFFSSPNFAKVQKVVLNLNFARYMESVIPQDRASFFGGIESLIRAAFPHFSGPNVSCVLSILVLA
ncbi:hypothetical protein NLJ89_g1740 [Agrocybe chaxingu]|uniref:Uncharacterized protein n=1 Tax=Agrocybe chaxingu TaxID=84603 RepID=A0A9W8MZH0_9AGAR|nr:hypothetical protein NLJ89_g1740 [Agrocybe chaxingu]